MREDRHQTGLLLLDHRLVAPGARALREPQQDRRLHDDQRHQAPAHRAPHRLRPHRRALVRHGRPHRRAVPADGGLGPRAAARHDGELPRVEQRRRFRGRRRQPGGHVLQDGAVGVDPVDLPAVLELLHALVPREPLRGEPAGPHQPDGGQPRELRGLQRPIRLQRRPQGRRLLRPLRPEGPRRRRPVDGPPPRRDHRGAPHVAPHRGLGAHHDEGQRPVHVPRLVGGRQDPDADGRRLDGRLGGRRRHRRRAVLHPGGLHREGDAQWRQSRRGPARRQGLLRQRAPVRARAHPVPGRRRVRTGQDRPLPAPRPPGGHRGSGHLRQREGGQVLRGGHPLLPGRARRGDDLQGRLRGQVHRGDRCATARRTRRGGVETARGCGHAREAGARPPLVLRGLDVLEGPAVRDAHRLGEAPGGIGAGLHEAPAVGGSARRRARRPDGGRGLAPRSHLPVVPPRAGRLRGERGRRGHGVRPLLHRHDGRQRRRLLRRGDEPDRIGHLERGRADRVGAPRQPRPQQARHPELHGVGRRGVPCRGRQHRRGVGQRLAVAHRQGGQPLVAGRSRQRPAHRPGEGLEPLRRRQVRRGQL